MKTSLERINEAALNAARSMPVMQNSLLTALGYYLGGAGKARQQSRDNARQDRLDESQSQYYQTQADLDRQRMGIERDAATEKKRLDDATLQGEGFDPATGQQYPFNPNTQIRPNNRGKVLASDSKPGTLAQNARRLSGEATAAQRPDRAKQYLDLAASYDAGAWKESITGLNQARVGTEQAHAAYMRAQAIFTQQRLGVSLQVAQSHENAMRYGADQRYRGVIAQVDALVARANLSAENARWVKTMGVWSATHGQDINASVRTAIANAQAAEALAVTEVQNAAPGSQAPQLTPIPVPPMPKQSFGDELKAINGAGYNLTPIPTVPIPPAPDAAGRAGSAGGDAGVVPDLESMGGSGTAGPLPPQYMAAFTREGRKFGVNPQLLQRMAQVKPGGGDPNAPPSAGGFMGFMPDTAAGYYYDPTNPVSTISAVAQQMGSLLKKNGYNEKLALAEYEGGPDAAAAWKAGNPQPESVQYVQKVLGAAASPAPSPGPSAPASPEPSAGPSAGPSPGPSPGPSASSGDEAKIRSGVSAFLASPIAAGKSFAQQLSLLRSMLAKEHDTTAQDYALAEKFLLEQRAERNPQRFNPLHALESVGQSAADAGRTVINAVMHPWPTMEWLQDPATRPAPALKPLAVPTPRQQTPPASVRTPPPMPPAAPAPISRDPILDAAHALTNALLPAKPTSSPAPQPTHPPTPTPTATPTPLATDTPTPAPTATPTVRPTIKPLPIRTLAPLPVTTPGEGRWGEDQSFGPSLRRRLQEIWDDPRKRFSETYGTPERWGVDQDFVPGLGRRLHELMRDPGNAFREVPSSAPAPTATPTARPTLAPLPVPNPLQDYGSELLNGARGVMHDASRFGNWVKSGVGSFMPSPSPTKSPHKILYDQKRAKLIHALMYPPGWPQGAGSPKPPLRSLEQAQHYATELMHYYGQDDPQPGL